MEEQIDIISRLVQRHMNDIAVKILLYLDISSLRYSELVSKNWYNFIKNDNLWKLRFEKDAKKNPQLYEAILQRGKCELKRLFLYKRLFIARHFVHRNWLFGKHVTITKNVGNDVYYYTMDAKRIVLAVSTSSFGYDDYNFTSSIKILNRWSMKSECVLENPTKTKIKKMQLQGEMLFCLHENGTVAIWDLTTQRMVKRIQNRQLKVLLHATKSLLIICSNFLSSNRNNDLLNVDTRITIYRIHNPNEIDVERTEDLVNTEVTKLESDSKYFALFLKTAPKEPVIKIELRSTADFQVIRELNIIYKTFIRFGYGSGWLVTYDEEQIKFWDAETLTCCRSSNPTYGSYMEPCEIFVNSDHALTLFGTTTRTEMMPIYNFFVYPLPNKESSQHQSTFSSIQLKRARFYSHFFLDELQIVTLDRTHRCQLVCLDFMKHQLRGPVM